VPDQPSRVYLVPGPGGDHVQPVFYWHGAIDHITETAVHRYADGLLTLQPDMDETANAVFVWNTPGGRLSSAESIKESYARLEQSRIRVWTVADNEALSAGAHLVAGGVHGRRFAMPHALLGIHSIDRAHYYASRISDDIQAMTVRAQTAGHRLDARRQDFIRGLVIHLVHRSGSISEYLRSINASQARMFAEYSTVLKNPASFEPMTSHHAMTYLDRPAAVEHGLIDREQIPRWLYNVVRGARREAAVYEPHRSTDERTDLACL